MTSFLSLSPVLLPDFYLAAVEENWRTRLCIPVISIDEKKNATLTFIMQKGLHPILIVTGFSLKDSIVKFGVGIDHAIMLKLILQDRRAMDLC